MLKLLLFSVLIGNAAMAAAEIRTQEVTYSGGAVDMKGFLAWDDSIEGKRPGILVVHEWWGHNQYTRTRAKMLASLGYTALAVDMYGDGKIADHPDDAGAFMTAVLENMESGRARFEAAHELLKSHATVDAGKIGAIGYCFGGVAVIECGVEGLGGALDRAHARGPGRRALGLLAEVRQSPDSASVAVFMF